MYSFEGLAGPGIGGGAGADAKKPPNFFSPGVKDPTTVARAKVNVSAITTTPMYFERLECGLWIDLLRERIFFLPIESSFFESLNQLLKQSWKDAQVLIYCRLSKTNISP
jgi:hypothetical protein